MIEFDVLSRKGISRDNNEDSYAILTELAGGCTALIIADGMGGHNSGEIASSRAVAYISDKLKDMDITSKEEICLKLGNTISEANYDIYRLSLENPLHAGMGTTLTVSYICGNSLFIGHIGDSRVYLIRNGSIRLLTSDHTYIEELVRNGSITRTEAKNHPDKNAITRAVGIIPEVKPDIYFYDIIDADTLLICTDGLTGSVTEDEMLEAFLNNISVKSICEALVGIAVSRGGQDDVTVMAVKFSQSE